MVKTQPLPPVCVTVNVCPAIVIVPLRVLVLLFAATMKPTAPLPAPLAPEVMTIQSALLFAAQLQPPCVVTFTLPLPPLAPKFWLVGESVNVQLLPPDCVTVKVCPATVNVPARELAPVLAATA